MIESIKRKITQEEIKKLNKKYHQLTLEQRVEELYKDFDAEEVMLTSSKLC